MAWVATAIGAGLGLIGANKQAKAQNAATEAQMAGFNQYKPYVDSMLEKSSAALDGRLNAGYYQGPTLAGPNGYQTGTATNMGNYGLGMQGRGYAMMDQNSGFGLNANNLYGAAVNNAANINDYTGAFDRLYGKNMGVGNNIGRLAGNTVGYTSGFNDLANTQNGITGQFQGLADRAQNTDMVANANQYALDNYKPLADAALRDESRNLNENTLTNIDMTASGSGNMNSSRAGVAEAVARRAYDDRASDVRSSVINDLRNTSLNQQNQQFGMATNALSGATNSVGATGSQLGNSVNALTSAGNLYGGQSSAYNSAGSAASGAVDTIGAVNSSLNTAGNFNNQISSAYNTGMNTLQTGGTLAMNAGNALQGYDQAALNDARANFEGNRDYTMGVLADYNANILGRAPNSSQAVTPNMNSPIAGAIGGAMSGYGFQQQYFPNGFGMFGGGAQTYAPTSAPAPMARPW